MTDIAQLGISIDTTSVVGATSALKQFATAAQPASDAAANLQQTAGFVTESLRGQRLVLAGLTADLGLLGGGLGQVAGIASTLYLENAHLLTGWSGLKDAIGGLLTPTNLLIGATAALVMRLRLYSVQAVASTGPLASIVLSGQLTIQDRESGKSQTFHTGQAFAETVNDVHRGVSGDTPTVLLITYAATPGVPTSIPVKGEMKEY